MSEITQVEAVQAALVKVIGTEAAKKVANLKDKELEQVYNLVFQQAAYHNVLPEETTVQGVIQEMYFMVHNEIFRTFEPEEADDFLIQRLMLLSELLGVELKDD